MSPTLETCGTVKTSPLTVKDNGNVRIGFATPAFPPVGPAPANVTDNGKVRTGFATPAFPPLRAR